MHMLFYFENVPCEVTIQINTEWVNENDYTFEYSSV